MKFAHLSEVNAGYVREVYEYESVEEMRKKNHPNFYPYIVPCGDEVERFWMFTNNQFEEPKLFEVVNGHVYMPNKIGAQVITDILAKNTELENANIQLSDYLAQVDETAIEIYETSIVQKEINDAQDDALIELYEMIGG